MPSPKYEQPNFTWENSECVVIRLRINSPTQDDSGTYFCSVRYNSDIMSEKIVVQSDAGQMDVNIGNVCLNVLPIVQCANSYVTLFLHTNICLYSVSMLSNGINHNTIYFSCYCKAFWIATDVMLSVMLVCSKFSTALIWQTLNDTCKTKILHWLWNISKIIHTDISVYVYLLRTFQKSLKQFNVLGITTALYMYKSMHYWYWLRVWT